MVNLPEIHQQQPRMMPKHQCRCGVLFRSIQAIKRFKNRVVDAKRSIFGTGFPSFSSHHPFEAQAAVVNDQHDVDDNMLINSMEDYDLTELDDSSWNMFDVLEEEQPATLSPSPAVTLIQAEESSDRTHNPHNQTSSLSSGLIEYTSPPDNKWTLSDLENLDLSEVNNCLSAFNFPDIPDEPVEGVMSTTILATTTTITTSYNTYNYGSETAPRVNSTTAYNGKMYNEYGTGSSVQNYDLRSQILMRDEGFQSSQIIAPPSPRRWCVLKLIVWWACKHLRFSRLTCLRVQEASQILVTNACQQRLKRRSEDFEGTRSRKKGSGKKWVVEKRMTTKTNGPNPGKLWLGSYSTPVEAARAYDVGKMFCSKAARSFNFPESQSILEPYKNAISQLPIPQKKETIKMIAKQYGETGSVNPSQCLFLR